VAAEPVGPGMTEAHYTHSTLRERIAEHVFVGDALRALWRLGIHDVEVLRPEFDAHGYDLVMARGRVVRHIQFKTGTARRPARVSLARVLAEKPSGCAIWMRLGPGLEMGPYFWLGGAPGEPLPPIAGYANSRRAMHNKEGVRPVRTNHHDVPGSAFQERETLEDILGDLFGELSDGTPGP
jgi:hypothetical protein